MKEIEFRSYLIKDSIVFWKTKEQFGGFSNMAGGFPLEINNQYISTAEALYQACKFPHNADLQRRIISQNSPIFAKNVAKPFEKNMRADWMLIRVNVMRWCLRVKLLQNWNSFSKLLVETKDKPIVEYSEKDDFWGAMPHSEEELYGRNVLGRLLMELRSQLSKQPERALWHNPKPGFSGNLFLGEEIYNIPLSCTKNLAHPEFDFND